MTSSSSSSSKVLKSITDFNANNPDAPTAAAALAKGTGNAALPQKRPTPRMDGMAKCCRNGCQKLFVKDENNPNACRYHDGSPVFGGNEKWWSCCPESGKYWEFERFQKIPPCKVGFHLDEVERYDQLLAEMDQKRKIDGCDQQKQSTNIHAAMGYDGRRLVAHANNSRETS